MSKKPENWKYNYHAKIVVPSHFSPLQKAQASFVVRSDVTSYCDVMSGASFCPQHWAPLSLATPLPWPKGAFREVEAVDGVLKCSATSAACPASCPKCANVGAMASGGGRSSGGGYHIPFQPLWGQWNGLQMLRNLCTFTSMCKSLPTRRSFWIQYGPISTHTCLFSHLLCEMCSFPCCAERLQQAALPYQAAISSPAGGVHSAHHCCALIMSVYLTHPKMDWVYLHMVTVTLTQNPYPWKWVPLLLM